MANKQLHKIANQMVAPNKGILASDESNNTANKTLERIGVEPTEENRRRYREVFINTPNIGKYINAIILSEETVLQTDSSGKPFKETLLEQEILVGVKVDKGTTPLPGFPEEKYTLGLEDLPSRIANHKKIGASFTKWRSVIKIGENIPTQQCIEKNASDLAVYAATVQKFALVPILEPEVLINGAHSIERSYEVTRDVLKEVFRQAKGHKVDLRGIILKSSMVLPGDVSPVKASPEEIAIDTVECLKGSVPTEVPGIVFLSGGQSPENATKHLSAIAELEPLPWEITFSFLRAIEGPAAEVWAGKDENIEKARAIFEQRLIESTKADRGEL